VRVVDHAIDHGNHMLRDADNQSPARQFIGSQMDPAARADGHGWRPSPSKRIQDAARGVFVDTSPGAAPLGAPSRDAFLLRMVVQQIVDGLIRHPAGYGDGSADAVAGFATVAGR